MNKPRLRLGSQQDQEEPEIQGLPPGWGGGGVEMPLVACCLPYVPILGMK